MLDYTRKRNLRKVRYAVNLPSGPQTASSAPADYSGLGFTTAWAHAASKYFRAAA